MFVGLSLLLLQFVFYNKLFQQKFEALIHFFLVWSKKHIQDVLNTQFC